MKLPDMKLTDQCAGHENAGHEIVGHEIAGHENAGHENDGHDNDGPKLTAGRKVAEAEIQFKRSYHYHEVCKYLNTKHCITLCIRRKNGNKVQRNITILFRHSN